MIRKTNTHRKTISVLNLAFAIPLILFCSHLIIDFRRSYLDSYNWCLFSCLFILLLLVLVTVHKLTLSLDRKSTPLNLSKRIGDQFVSAFFYPLLAIIILLVIYDKSVDDRTIGHSFHKELGVVIAFLYIVNTFYSISRMNTGLLKKEPDIVETKILVYFRGAYTPVNLTDIAFIYQQHQINWLVTFNKQEYILDRSLNSVIELLDPVQFFKINRSHIVNKEAICCFKIGKFGKLVLLLKDSSVSSTVSKDRAKLFRAWFYR